MQLIEISEPGLANNENNQEFAVGIDFGTTNSLIAASYCQLPKIFKSQDGKELVPSTIEFKNQRFIIGKPPSNLSSLKRLLGKTKDEILNSPTLFSLIKDFIDPKSNILKLNFANQLMTIPEIIAKVFLHLKHQAENELKTSVTKAVITVPAHFNDAARGELMLAAKIAGFDVLRLVAEPTAAAYAYGLNKKQDGCYLVYDLGGGTFDVSIVRMQEGILQVIATAGDNMLGGDDIDYLVAQYLKSNIFIAKSAKEALSYKNEFNANKVSLSRAKLEQLISPLIQRTIQIAHDALKHADNIDIDGIILVGGATRTPLVTNMLKESFNVKIFSDIDPDIAVVWGAALQAENLTSNRINSSLAQLVPSLLIDVVPLSVGLELYGGLVEKIIMRNSPMPISVTKEFTTYADNQTGIQFHILQGEREMVSDCRSLARFELKGLPLMKAGSVRVEVTFSIDADGILSVSALEKLTGKLHIIEVKPTYGLSKAEINEILENAYKNTSNDHQSRLLNEAIINTKSLIYNTEAAIKEMPKLLPSNEMSKIRQALDDLKKSIVTRNRDLITKKHDEFELIIKKFTIKRLNTATQALLQGKHIDKEII